MDVDYIYISISTLFYLHRTYFLHTTSILTLALLFPKLLGLPPFYRTTIFLCVTAYLVFFTIKRYSPNLPPEEDDTAPPDIDTTPTLSRGAKPTMQTSPTFERVQAAGKAKPTSAVVWPKSQVWKRDAQVGRRDGVGRREREEEMRW
ncbi:hypothetical protein J4E89_006006 [Alternaria sp. Ai002NY15]|nr:hypothetical protein J4E89_006006 [Alternaria sp. Ai002NY15]